MKCCYFKIVYTFVLVIINVSFNGMVNTLPTKKGATLVYNLLQAYSSHAMGVQQNFIYLIVKSQYLLFFQGVVRIFLLCVHVV